MQAQTPFGAGKPIRLIVAYPPGGVSDLVARTLAPIDAAGAHRRELAEAAQEAVGAALRRDM